MKRLRIFDNPFIFLAVFCGLFFLFLVFRNMGLYPSVFADEYTYSKLSRLLPLSKSPIPDYIYLKLYSVTNYCGDGFLGCARLINAAMFILAAPFIFLISRRVANNGVSITVSLLAILGPINSYTAYFMPESFYFLAFWIFLWYLTGLNREARGYHWFLAGSIYAISSLVKPHAIFLLPAILLYIAFVFFREQYLFGKLSAVAFFSFILGALLVKFGVGYAFAGPAGLTIFGPMYGSIATSTVSGASKYIPLLLVALESFKGHMLVVVLLYGLPLTFSVIVVVKALTIKNIQVASQDAQYERIAFLSLVVVFSLICVTALFTASVANSGPYETPYRLHMRYYNFALPILYIVAAGALSTNVDINKYLCYILGVVAVISGACAILNNLAPYVPNYIDSPEIHGLQISKLAFRIVGGLLILSIVLWVIFKRRGVEFYLYFALPLFVVVSSYYINSEIGNRLKSDVYDRAGIFVHQYLASYDLSKVIVVGSDAAGLFRALYYVDNAKASIDVIGGNSNCDLLKLPADKEWVLLIGRHKPVGGGGYQIIMNGFSLIHVAKTSTVDFKRGAWPGIISSVDGLSTPEPWGTWSQSDTVRFEFAAPLPSEFELRLTGHAFGPNVNNEFEVFVGSNSKKFKLSETDGERIIRLKNPGRSQIIRIKIPNAISPKVLGLGDDERNLGIGFVKMQLVPLG